MTDNIKRLKKILKFILKFILKLSTNFLLDLINIYRPVKLIYFRTNRLGHLALNTEVFLRRQQQGMRTDDFLSILIPDDFIANKTLYEKYKKIFDNQKNVLVVENRILRWMLFIMYKVGTKHSLEMEMMSNEYELFCATKPSIVWSSSEIEQGNKILKDMGIDSWFVTIFARDSAYLNSIIHTFKGKNVDLSYHNFRDIDIDDFAKAIQYIIQQGGYVVRLGSVVEKRLSFQHKKVIDYPYTKVRSDFMDIFLVSQSKFVMGSTSGATDVCSVFNIPRVGIGWVPIDHMPFTSSQDIGIVKKMKRNGKNIGLNAYIDLEKNREIEPFIGHSYSDKDIVFENNNPKEIVNVCREMYESLEGSLKISEEDKKNQILYRKIHSKSILFSGVNTTMSYSFLRQNKWFLDLE